MAKPLSPNLLRSLAGLSVIGLFGASTTSAVARDFRVNQLPNGTVNRCANCHVNPGGGGARNAFGQAVGAITGTSNRAFWTPTLAAADSDGDGFANGIELGDPNGDGTVDRTTGITNPGNATSRPQNQAPTVLLTSPAAGTVFTAPAVAAVEATAGDTDGTIAQVEFFSGDRLLGVDTVAPYSLLVDWALGPHAVTARATDDRGASTTSAAVNMTVNAPEAPSLSRLSRTPTGVDLEWTQGGGPFAVQTKVAINDPWCSAGAVTTARTASVKASGDTSFYRVADLAVGTSVPMTAFLAGEFERPNPVTTTATGHGSFTVVGNTLVFDVKYSGLSGPATMAHIHGPAGVEEGAGILIDLAPFNGGAFGTEGTLSGSVVLTPEQKAAILGSRTYVNVHTAANPPGEIRGQILPQLMQAALSGANERPSPVASSGFGGGHFLLSSNQLTFTITYGGLSGPATRAHIHGPADIDASAGILVDLGPFNGGGFGVAGSFSGTVTLTPAQLTALAAGLTYVNVHTEANAPGEIRGQIRPCVTAQPFAASMNGAAERPTPVVTSATGAGILALEGDTLLFQVTYGGLSGPAIAAHIHGPAGVDGNAGVMINLAPFNGGAFGVRGTFAGGVVLTAEQKAALLAGQTYLNIHTDANGAGEIRGQILSPATP